MGIKRDKYDKVISDYIRLVRDKLKCQKCGKQYEFNNRQGIHASHLFSRRHSSTRYNPDNLFSHCFGCHSLLGGNPVLFYEWAVSEIGKKKVEALKRKALEPKKWKKGEKDEYVKSYKEALKKAGY